MKTRAMVLREFKKPLVMEELEIPVLAEGQVLVRLEASGVCGSDVHIAGGEDPRIRLPMIPGHEGVGRIAALRGQKKDVDGAVLKEGDRIIWNRGVSCGHCYYCAVLHEPSLCPERQVYGISAPKFAIPNGCFSEYVLLDAATDLFLAGEDIDPAALVCASCSGATAAHAFDLVRLQPGASVVIQGPGPIGMFSAYYAKIMGADRIIVIGGSEKRLGLCRAFGATEVVDRHAENEEERLAHVLELTGGRGADLVIEAVGAQGAAEEGIRYVRRGGDYLSIGYSQPAGMERLDFFADVVRRSVHIHGVWVSDTRHTRQALAAIVRDPALFEQLADARYPLSRANDALADMADKSVMKAVLLPETIEGDRQQ